MTVRSFRSFLKFFLRILITRIHVRMVFFRKNTVCFFNFSDFAGAAGGAADAGAPEDDVVDADFKEV